MAATAIHNDLGQVIASLALTWQGGDLRGEWADALQATAQRISAALGWQAPL
jgi:DNA-binding IclR family transcriptional regulator